MLEYELDALRIAVTGGTALEVDDALLPLIARSDPSILAPILLLLNEDGDQDGMWSILHTAESFDGSTYIAGLLSALPELRLTCFEWAKILVIRILNSDDCRVTLIEQLGGAPAPAKSAVSAICEAINQDARFSDKTAPVQIAAMT